MQERVRAGKRLSFVLSLGGALLLGMLAFRQWIRGTLAPGIPASQPPGRTTTLNTTCATAPSPTARFPVALGEPQTPQSDRPDPRSVGSPLAAELNAASGNAAHDVETLHALLRQYLRHLHRRQGLPIGNDSDLVRALTGHNPMKLVVLPPNHPAITPNGHLRDRWETPYFIHPRGNNAFEIRSAGADRKLFTSDDAVENPPQRQTEGEPEP